jgi:UDP-glucose 4-epimerase/UDP-glucuronate decarboxylase
MENNILITGGLGFIGLHLGLHLAKNKKNHITLIDNGSRHGHKTDPLLERMAQSSNIEFAEIDISTPEGWDEVLIEMHPRAYDYVYHLAAINGTKNFYERPEEVLRVNLSITLHLLESCKDLDLKGLLFTSSSETYAGGVTKGIVPIPTPENIPLIVEDITNPRWSYGISKIAGESLFLHYNKRYNMNARIVRYHNIYGPRMGYDHVIPEFIERMSKIEKSIEIDREERNKVRPFIVKGNTMRAFCYIADAVRATEHVMLEPSLNGQVINVGNSKLSITMNQLAYAIAGLMGRDICVDEKPAPEGSVNKRCPDISKLIETLDFYPEWNIKSGLTETVQWYLDNPK